MTTLRINEYKHNGMFYEAWEYTLYNWTKYMGRAVIRDTGYAGYSLPYVDGISLEEQYRGKGYGTWFMGYVIKRHPELVLRALPDRVPWYERMGFVIVRKVDDGTLRMELRRSTNEHLAV